MIRSVLPAAGVAIVLSEFARAVVPVIGGPTYDAATNTGFKASPTQRFIFQGDATAFDGYGLAMMSPYSPGSNAGTVPVRFGPNTFTVYASPALPGGSSAWTYTNIYKINAAGIAVGAQWRNDTSSRSMVQQAIRWNNPAQPVVLGNGISGSNVGSYAGGINAAGTIVGTSTVFQADSYGFVMGTVSRPVRWAANMTTATPLDVNAQGSTANNSGECRRYRRQRHHIRHGVFVSVLSWLER